MNLNELIEMTQQEKQIMLEVIDEKKKVKGILKLKNCSLRKFYTFLDLHIKNGLNLVPIVAVDFSLANLTFDENCYCLHTLK